MHKILRIAKREYKAAVRTKGFIIGLVLAPVLMGGSGIAMVLFEKHVDTTDKKIVVIDHSGLVAPVLEQAAKNRNENEIHDKITGKKIKPAFIVEIEDPQENDLNAQRLALSKRVRSKEIHAFLEINENVLHPDTSHAARIAYYAENASMDELRGWFGWPINNYLRRQRLESAGVNPDAVRNLFDWIDIEGMGLVSTDEETGEIIEARRSSEGEALLIPLVFGMMMFMMIMMGAMPLLSAVMEEKNQRIAEVMLGSVKPSEFMAGKVIGGVGVSLTASLVYIVIGSLSTSRMGLTELVPYHLIPWFLSYMLLAIILFGSLNAALGSACNDQKDAQQLSFPAMIPAMIPMFVLIPVIREPLGTLATAMSLIPFWTPVVMLLRLGTPVEIPAWQPWVGLAGMILFTMFGVWAGGRIFRIGILMQGRPPRLADLVRWAIRG
ncbi:MAG: ABC transporter permease [Candidatus Eisenbacteria bacterium]|uniref:ABC transporter permease n=1 Tax=Eiseniibacteriota bacterium TaxID=2212470 RepID=A0A948RSW6_UNCEI|nr:ABC transporter permease [Candidatus Eisenbacteria bacterium]MBU1950258.1 ABC transporter permease [Candidatus Eisenbacteria bacterium]MBU2689976.1 ABC transporter permease [Candidatus Eisenbacteria bacterium]